MPTRLLLDGEDLQALMARVRDEMGPDVRIVKAERIRTGGVAGFFAREHYELTVEVPDAERPRLGRRHSGGRAPRGSAHDAAAGGASGLDALLAAADAAEQVGLGGGGAGDVRVGGGGGSGGGGSDGGAAGGGGPDGGAADGGGPDGGAADGGVDVAAGRVTSGRTADTPEADQAPVPQVSTAGDTFADVLESMRQLVGVPAAAAEPVEPPASGHVGRTPPPPGLEPERAGSSVNSLLELGIPTRLLVGFADPKAAVPLSVLVRRFDPPPSLWLAPGRVIAVVGEGSHALATARQMAHRAGTDPFDIVLAGEMEPVTGHGRRLQTPAAVARYRSRIAPDLPALVAVGVGPDRADWSAAAALIAALEPSQTWAVLDARRKAVDLRRWLRAVGARRAIDAVAATSTFEAQAPGTVLNLGTPVGWVDGLPASPVVWAAVLSERLADDARWD